MLIVNNKKYTTESFLERFENSTEQYLNNICSLIRHWNDESNKIDITTSGSTSTPKTISLDKSSIKASALGTQAYFGYKDNDNALLCLPVKYIGGMMMLIRSLISNLNLYIVDPSLNPLSQLKSKIQFAPMTPAQLITSIKKNKSKIENIDKILLGGGPVSVALLDQISNLKSKVYHSFGMTETISHIAIKELNYHTKDETFFALNGVQLSIDDHSCLVIEAGYLKNKVITNDVVELINEEQFIWKGRRDNVINSGGVKLYPEVIEHKLSKVINEKYFITGIDDDILGQKLCLVLETNKEIDHQSYINRISKYLDRFEIPKAVYCVKQFAKTETGKVIRKKTLNRAIIKHKESAV
ncbi:AMP-binding protein [Saprospiraceae bacterium]|nr:AMP-binding protein [Saprospiraceae bacterium]